MKLFLFILLVILFLPIPIKLKVFFSIEDYYIKVYKFTVLKKHNKKKTEETPIKDKKTNTTYYTKQKKKKSKFNKDFNLTDIFSLISIINKNRFKPWLYIKGYVNYSLTDAYYTAISYGLISTYLPIINWGFNILFNIKNFILPVKPIFKDKLLLTCEFTSIILVSIAQTIYMAFLIIKGIILIKVKKLEGG